MCRKTWCPSGHHCPEGLTCMLVFAIFSAVLGMFQFGYNTGVINAPQKILENFIADVYKTRTNKYMSEQMLALVWSVTVSVFAVGGMVGGISGGAIADYCGRKCGLLLNNAIAILGATLMSSSQLFRSIECLIMGRFFIGLSCGLNTALVPMYLSEIAPMTLRGALGTVSQLGVTIGLLLSQILGLPVILGTEDGWPFLLGVAFIPAILQLMLLPLCPESPRYLLISKGRLTEATYALQRLRCTSNVEDDIEEMRIEDRAQQQEARITLFQLVSNRSLQAPLIIGIVMQLSQQLSGINAIFYYSTNIFTSAGLGEKMAKYSTIGVGVVMVAMSLVSIMLMDRTGRRTLHLYGLGGMFITSMFLTIFLLFGFLYTWMSYMSVISTLIYVVFFAIGPGSIPWMITAELFSQGPRPAAMSIAVLVNWFTNFVVGLGFPLMTTFNDNAMERYAFLPFTAFLAIFWIFTYFKVPETKNRTFEEIAALFRKDTDGLIQIDEVGGNGGSRTTSCTGTVERNFSTGGAGGGIGGTPGNGPGTGYNSHKSSCGDIYSHKSSSGDIVFSDERTLEKCYLQQHQHQQQQQQQHHHHHLHHHHHHGQHCRYEDDDDEGEERDVDDDDDDEDQLTQRSSQHNLNDVGGRDSDPIAHSPSLPSPDHSSLPPNSHLLHRNPSTISGSSSISAQASQHHHHNHHQHQLSQQQDPHSSSLHHPHHHLGHNSATTTISYHPLGGGTPLGPSLHMQHPMSLQPTAYQPPPGGGGGSQGAILITSAIPHPNHSSSHQVSDLIPPLNNIQFNSFFTNATPTTNNCPNNASNGGGATNNNHNSSSTTPTNSITPPHLMSMSMSSASPQGPPLLPPPPSSAQFTTTNTTTTPRALKKVTLTSLGNHCNNNNGSSATSTTSSSSSATTAAGPTSSGNGSNPHLHHNPHHLSQQYPQQHSHHQFHLLHHTHPNHGHDHSINTINSPFTPNHRLIIEDQL